jgi:hypothetical protein
MFRVALSLVALSLVALFLVALFLAAQSLVAQSLVAQAAAFLSRWLTGCTVSMANREKTVEEFKLRYTIASARLPTTDYLSIIRMPYQAPYIAGPAQRLQPKQHLPSHLWQHAPHDGPNNSVSNGGPGNRIHSKLQTEYA